VDDDTRRSRGAAFSAVADDYERSRPGYPDAAVEWMVGTQPLRVLELGAGTGKLTRSLVARRHSVVATDPSAAMLDRLVGAGLPVETAVAGAEQLPFADSSVDAVVAAQAFHWFDASVALPEIVRVLRPAGTFAVVWNLRDESVPWVRKLTALLRTRPGELVEVATIEASPLFTEVESARHRFWQQLDRAGLHALVQSRSSVALLGGDERLELVRQVDALYSEYAHGSQGLRLPYVTHSFRTSAVPKPKPDPAPASDGAAEDDGEVLFQFR